MRYVNKDFEWRTGAEINEIDERCSPPAVPPVIPAYTLAPPRAHKPAGCRKLYLRLLFRRCSGGYGGTYDLCQPAMYIFVYMSRINKKIIFYCLKSGLSFYNALQNLRKNGCASMPIGDRRSMGLPRVHQQIVESPTTDYNCPRPRPRVIMHYSALCWNISICRFRNIGSRQRVITRYNSF